MIIEELLDKLDELLDEAWTFPLSNGKCVVDEEKIRDIILDIRGNMPAEIKKAQNTLNERESIIKGARAEAESIISTAKEKAMRMISEDTTVKAAQQKANEILTSAQRSEKEMKNAAMSYSLDRLSEVEKLCNKFVLEINETKKSLKR